ncbi:MAG: sugar phosphate isomerase/epimerase [Clostridia bacterium]|nr:sugar phosphate isomerase/epimerase [Clostridia bacterium]
MKLGITNNAYNATWENPDGYRKMREHGYEYADFQELTNRRSPYYTDRTLVYREREAAEAAGVHFYQLHSLWPTRETTEEGWEEKVHYMEMALEIAPLLGCPRVVFHSDMPLGWDKDDEELAWHSNERFVTRVLPAAERANVILCIENMPMKALSFSRVENMIRLVEQFDHPLFGMCLDTGHAAVFGDDCGDAVRRIGRHLQALHVHDNDGSADQHLLPGQGVIDWERFRVSLHEVGFDGSFSFETAPSRELPPAERETAFLSLAAFGKRMIEKP